MHTTTITKSNQPRRINCEAMRTLQAVEKTLRKHIADLTNLDCEDAEAAEAVVFAIESAENALRNVSDTRRRIN